MKKGMVLAFAVVSVSGILAARPSASASSPSSEDGRYLSSVREFADTFLAHGLDHYGKIHTPMWVSVLSLKTLSLLESKAEDPNWQHTYNAEDYWREARGSNLYRNIYTLRTFYELSRLTGDPKYQQAADAYLTYFMNHCQSPTTGLYAWGEHMTYNVVRDQLTATRHELERQLPPWEEMWRLNPESVTREINAIYRINIYDKKTFDYDRHANFYTGEPDPMAVRGAYVKHSGLFAYSFYFLYLKTGDPKYLDWALKVGEMFWKVRNPNTNLVADAWEPTPPTGPVQLPAYLAYYLLRTYQLDHRQKALLHVAAGLVRAWTKYAYDPSTGKFFAMVNASDGAPAGAAYQSAWGNTEGILGFEARACIGLYMETRDPWFLDMARKYALFIMREPVLSTTSGENYGNNLLFLLDLYTATKDPAYLHAVRRYANLAEATMFKNGLINEYASGYVYNANRGPGELAWALLKLYDTDKKSDVPASPADNFPQLTDWKFSAWHHPNKTIPVKFHMEGVSEVRWVGLQYRFDDGRGGQLVYPGKPADGTYQFAIPAPGSFYAGKVQFHAQVWSGTDVPWRALSAPQTAYYSTPLPAASATARVEGTKATIESLPTCPLPPDQALANGLPGYFRVKGSGVPSGQMVIHYPAEETQSYLEGAFQIAYWTGQQWRLLATRHNFATQALRAQYQGPGLYGIAGTPRLKWRYASAGALNISPAMGDVLGNGQLQVLVPSGDTDRHLYAFDASGKVLWRFPTPGGVSSPQLFDVNGDGRPEVLFTSTPSWRSQTTPVGTFYIVGGRAFNMREAKVKTSDIVQGTLYAVNGQGRMVWSKSLPGVLTAPAIAGQRIVVGSSAGEVFALSRNGKVAWRYKTGAAVVTTPAVAELLQKVHPTILVACHDGTLRALSDQGKLLWSYQTGSSNFLPLAVGDINGDGRPEVVFASNTRDRVTGNPTPYVVVALTAKGQKLWSYDTRQTESEWAPVLADMDGLGYQQVVVETKLQPWPLCELTILDKNGRRLRGIPIPSRATMRPVITDLNGDGKPDILVPTNEDRKLFGIANNGHIMWSFQPLSYIFGGAKMKGGGTPAVADIDGDGRLEIVVGDDETNLNCVRTETRVKPYTIVSRTTSSGT